MLNTIIQSFDIWTDAQGVKSKGRVKSVDNISLEGIARLRELILELAITGKLVSQNNDDEPALELLKKIETEKKQLIEDKIIRKPKKLSEISESEKFFNLPSGWQFVRLNDIGDWGAGATPTRSYSAYYGGNIPWFKSGELSEDYISESEETVTDLALKKTSLRYNNIGDVLIAMYGATIGKTSILKVRATTNQAVCACTPFKGIYNVFLLILLKAFKTRFTERGAGGAQPNISREKIIETVIGLPPLEEQKRIVAKVDELMALCDKLEEEQTNNLKTHQTLVKTLLETLTQAKNANELQIAWKRMETNFDTLFCTEDSIEQLKQTILQLAVMGKLVKQDPNDEPASVLVEKIATEKEKLIKEGKIKKQKPLPAITEDEKPFDIPETWNWVKFDNIAENTNNALKAGPFGSALKKSMYVAKGFKIYGQEQVISGDEDFGEYYISPEKYDSLSSCSVKSGDILISLVGTIGKVLVLSDKCLPGIINPRLVKLSLYNEINRDYIRLMLAAPFIQEELEDKSHGGTMNILNLGLIRSLVFPIPPVKEQLLIINKVETLFNLCESFKSKIERAQGLKGLLSRTIVEKAIK